MERGRFFVIRHGGRDFLATEEMARIFQRQAERVIAAGNADLVVLRHRTGVDLLLVSGRDSYSIVSRPVVAQSEVAGAVEGSL